MSFIRNVIVNSPRKPKSRRRAAAMICLAIIALGAGVLGGFSLAHDTLVEGGGIGIARRVEDGASGNRRLDELPSYDPKNANPFQVDLRGADISGLDLSGREADLRYCAFDSGTAWPSALPQGFDPQKAFELGKDPGLGVRGLHGAGIDGRGVSIAIIDHVLMTDHAEYADNLKHYEEMHIFNFDASAGMHAGAVASIAVGKSVGVAPASELYYIATHAASTPFFGGPNLRYYADAIERILVLNDILPAERKIRVISMSIGWNPKSVGYAQIQAAVERAKARGIFVVSTAMRESYGFAFAGLGREPMGDPNDINSYSVGIFERANADFFKDALFFPMDSRAFAARTGSGDYCFNAVGGMSWSVPYIAGLYALAAQVQQDVTPQIFWERALQTADSLNVQNDGEAFTIKYLINPVKLIEALQDRPI